MSLTGSSDSAPNAKQIVFLFMAATVVAVVVFLCGVLVGRGVPLNGRATVAATAAPGYEEVPTSALGLPRSEPSAGAAVSEDLSYGRILAGETADLVVGPLPGTAPPSVVVLPEKDSAADEFKATAAVLAAEVDLGADPPADILAADAESVPPSEGYYVQVVALHETHAVSGVVDRLLDKGLPAVVVNPDADAPISLYRVRVGPYESRAEAGRVRQRIETEDKFAPFVTR